MKHQFMPMFWGDFFANTLNLTTATEVGAYVLLIGHAWEHGGQIPYKDARRIARLDHRQWKKLSGRLEAFFELEKDASGAVHRMLHRRVLTELAIADKLINKRKAAGMAGAIKRWGKDMASAMPEKWQHQCDTNGKLEKKERKKKERRKEPPLSGPRAREEPPPEKPEEQTPPASSLATALPTGALARPPTPEQVAKKPPHKASVAELLESYAKKRNGKAPPP
jgi:uncharacterized protein YdaU (DUF1376 family)